MVFELFLSDDVSWLYADKAAFLCMGDFSGINYLRRACVGTIYPSVEAKCTLGASNSKIQKFSFGEGEICSLRLIFAVCRIHGMPLTLASSHVP